MADAALPDAVLDFWFGPAPHAPRDVWFRKDAAFDAEIRARFGAAVVRRFGRYPHRNAILGRTSTPEELAFLALPGSRF